MAGHDLVEGKIADRHEGYRDVEEYHKNDGEVVSAGQRLPRFMDVTGGVSYQFESFVGQEDNHSSSNHMEWWRPSLRLKPLGVDAPDASADEQNKDRDLKADDQFFCLADSFGAQYIQPSQQEHSASDENVSPERLCVEW